MLRSNHSIVRPHAGAGPSVTQVLPTARRGIAPTARRGIAPTAHRGIAPAGRGTAPAASAASASSGVTPPQAGTPAYIQQAYDLTFLSQTAGRGDTIAIVDAYDDPNAESDLAVYRSEYGLPPCTTDNGCFTKLDQSGTTNLPPPNQGWEAEISLDLDAVSAICPNCSIRLYVEYVRCVP